MAPSASRRVIFEPEGRVFKLFAGDSLYALRVSEADTLEHLYWGPALAPDVDIRYMSRSNVPQPFDPTIKLMVPEPEEPKRKDIVRAEVERQIAGKTWRGLFDVWRAHRGGADPERSGRTHHSPRSGQRDRHNSTFERRLENMTWRLLGMNKLGDERLEGAATALLGEKMLADTLGSSAKKSQLAPSPSSMSLETDGSNCSSGADTGEPAPRGLEFLSVSKAKPLGLKKKKFTGMARSERTQSVPQNLSEAEDEASHKLWHCQPGGRSIDMHALDLPLSDDRLAFLSESLDSLTPVGSSASLAGMTRGAGSVSTSSLAALGMMGERPALASLGELSPVRRGSDDSASSLAMVKEPFALPTRSMGSPRVLQQPRANELSSVGKNMTLSELADMGTGDYRLPTFVLRYWSDGSTISPLAYRWHNIVAGKPPPPSPMPHVRSRAAPPAGAPDEAGPEAATTLVVTLEDLHTGMRVEAHFTAMHDLDVIVRRTVVCNTTMPAQRVSLERLMSATVDFDVSLHGYWGTTLCGSWARERGVSHTRLEQGVKSFGSLRGTSSHQHAPFLAISAGHAPPDETHGHVHAFSLVYSGSFSAEAELVDVGRLRVNMGIQHLGFSWHLEPGDTFSSPECVLVFSNAGLGRMSRTLHSLVREHVMPPTWRHVPMPVLVNTWEAEYFGVSHDSVVAMARAAHAVGVEMIVLDDGWFGERHDATSSLGDWTPNPTKFPFGIRGLAADVRAEGILFGLWIEPEMVSTNSVLYREHPDWCLHLPGRAMSEGRNQLVLDLTRHEVREHIFQLIAAVVKSADVSYIKWDMNRHLTEAFSVALPPSRQGEVLFRYTMGVYALHERFTSAFPNIRFEACSGGGGRFDLGILYYCPQVWCSDNTDATMRMRIQHGTSFAFPAITVGAHYSTVPNHITQGVSRKRTRALVAMCGTFGYELDLRKLGAVEVAAMRRQIGAHKLVAPIVRDGELHRLWDPFSTPYCAWMYVLRSQPSTPKPSGKASPREVLGITRLRIDVSGDGARPAPSGTRVTFAAVFAFNMSSTFWSNLVPRLRLAGLDPDASYIVTEPLPNNRMQKPGTLEVVQTPAPVYQLGDERVLMYGATLMEVGIPIRFLTQDDSLMFHLQLAEATIPV